MSLSDLAAIGSFVSGIAVFFSFFFLAVQLRQANRNQRSLMQQARTSRNVEILLKMADPAVGETIAKADANYATLDAAGTWTFYGFAAAVFWSYEDSFMQFQAGTLHAESWQSDVATLKRLVARPPYRVVWKMARDGMSGGYRDYIDSLVREVSGDPSRSSLTDLFKIYIAEEMAAKPLG
jgi:predicted permease